MDENFACETHTPYINDAALPLWIVTISGWGSESMDEANKRMRAYKNTAEQLGVNIEFSSRLGTFGSYKHAPSVAKEIHEHNEKTFAAYEKALGADWRMIFIEAVQQQLKEK